MHDLGFRAVVVCVWVFIVGGATPSVDTRSAHMERPEEFMSFVLVIEDTQDGDAAHTWLPKSEFNWPEPVGVDTRTEIESHVEPAALKKRDCEQEQLDCSTAAGRESLPILANATSRTIMRIARKNV